MTPRRPGRLEYISAVEVQARADAARRFDEVARLVEDEGPEYRQVAAALVALAGVAAADAICGRELGHRSRGQDHRQAVALLRQIKGAEAAGKALDALLSLKDGAHYGTHALSEPKMRAALRQSDTLLETMEAVLRR